MKIAIFYRHFPVAMGRYIHWGLEDAGHEVFSVGPYSRGKIPWAESLYYPQYKFPPDLELPDNQILPMSHVLKGIRKQGFKPDMIIQEADLYFLEGKADIPNILLGTDPHVVNYEPHLTNVDYYFSLQKNYMGEGKNRGWMPYGYDRNIHVYQPQQTIKYNVVFCGLQYTHRKDALRAISDRGYKVFCGLGYVYDDYVSLYNQGMIAFNWSSKDDLPARFWEGLAMKRCVLTNRVPDLKEFDLEEGVDYLGFSTKGEAVEKADFYLKRPELLFKIADNGYKKVKPHHWTNRVKKMLQEVKIK